MATLKTERKLAAFYKKNREEHLRCNLAENSNAPRSHEDYINQFSQEIEGKLTKKLSQEFSRTEKCILGALSRLDDFRLNPIIQGHSGTSLETSQNAYGTNRETNDITLSVIIILKQAFFRVTRHKTLAWKTPTTWWQEFTKKPHTLPSVHL